MHLIMLFDQFVDSLLQLFECVIHLMFDLLMTVTHSVGGDNLLLDDPFTHRP